MFDQITALNNYITSYVIWRTHTHTSHYITLHYITLQYIAIQYNTIQYNAIQYNTMQYIHTYTRMYIYIYTYVYICMYRIHTSSHPPQVSMFLLLSPAMGTTAEDCHEYYYEEFLTKPMAAQQKGGHGGH